MGELHAIGPRADLVAHLENLTALAREGKIIGITYAILQDSYRIKPGWFGVRTPEIPQAILGFAMRASVNYLGNAMDEAATSG